MPSVPRPTAPALRSRNGTLGDLFTAAPRGRLCVVVSVGVGGVLLAGRLVASVLFDLAPADSLIALHGE